jgi:predicted nucleic acid-binding protein
MICLDTTFLIDLWRQRGAAGDAARGILSTHAGEVFAVPAHAAGEFLEGAACVSEDRLRQAVLFLRLFRFGEATFETAEWYARVVSGLRQRDLLAGRSKADLWIASWAMEHGGILATRNERDFRNIPDLKVLSY